MSASSIPSLRYPKWNASLSVGHARIDDEHREFLNQVERIAALIEHGGAVQHIRSAAAAMIGHLKLHFATEEAIFDEVKYPDAAAHGVEHVVLLHMAAHVHRAIEQSNELDYLRISLRYLALSVVEHLLETDMRYRPYLLPR